MEKEEIYIVETKDEIHVFHESEIINNALDQEKEGVKPSYRWRTKEGEKPFPCGWLVYSTLKSGCCVVYRRNDGKMIISTGSQGDFVYC